MHRVEQHGAPLVLLLVAMASLPAAAQERQWFPLPDAIAVAVDLTGRVVSSVPLAQQVADPWNGVRWTAGCGGTDIDLFGDRYYAGNRVPGSNPQGFANEAMFLNAFAVTKEVTGDARGDYTPLCIEVWDWAFTHARSCAVYGLTVADGCGTGTPNESSNRLPARLIEYCRTWPDACVPFPGCPCALCWTDRQITGFGGLSVRYDPTRAECRPDQGLSVKPGCEVLGVCEEAQQKLRDAVEKALRELNGGGS